ncbi:ComEA family DNA-binding protein [Pseudomonas sp. AS2.8]|uniref:ComEA family DNA-binding protein n=1 Tax=Pseudomonas sp. AS2.8 TaxID=2587128 RepID=UPI00161ED598|nr:ComEA family DNA-binding protein [Pseudomonas sp. AS2.8]MBB2895207.1 competence protein ComEA [Pseudomonas sp. AS2.8]
MRFIWIVTLLALFGPWANACESGTGAATKPASSVSLAPLNINVADVTALQRLRGIGAVKAQAIVDHRQAHGAFASVDELLEVKGIGKALLQRNRDLLSVD